VILLVVFAFMLLAAGVSVDVSCGDMLDCWQVKSCLGDLRQLLYVEYERLFIEATERAGHGFWWSCGSASLTEFEYIRPQTSLIRRLDNLIVFHDDLLRELNCIHEHVLVAQDTRLSELACLVMEFGRVLSKYV